MLFTYFGPGDALNLAFYNSISDDADIDFVSATPTRIVLHNPSTGVFTALIGTGLPTTEAELLTTTGILTGWTSTLGGNTIASITGLSWGVAEFARAIDELMSEDNPGPIGALLSRQPITIDASASTSGATWWDESGRDGFDLGGVTSPVTFIGSSGADDFTGGLGNDTFTVTANRDDLGDSWYGSAGNDQIHIQSGQGDSWVDLVYTNLGGPITAFVDGTTGTASVVKAGAGTDSVDGLGNLLGIGGYGIWGSDAADTFTIDTGAGGWMQVNGGRGSDRYNITLTGDVRLLFSGSWEDGATSGVNINLATGQILNDGFGNVEALVVTDGDGWLEIEATNRADTITGSARDELFILRGGNDTLNAGDGHDALRYDRGASTSAVAVDLQAGTATGTWEGVAFTHQISGIDEIRGTDYGDTIRGSMVHDRLLGRDGNDLLDGRDGGDRLEGDAGNDTLIGGNGNDTLNGGNGDDRIEVGRSVMGGGDWVIGSAGSDTIVYSNIVADSGWNDLSYADLGAGIAATINGVTNTGSVVKAGGGTDTLVDIARVVDGDSGGFSLFGTDHADSYAITTATNNWMQILGGRGADSYNITLSGGNVRLNFSGSWYDWLGATHALRINVGSAAGRC